MGRNAIEVHEEAHKRDDLGGGSSGDGLGGRPCSAPDDHREDHEPDKETRLPGFLTMVKGYSNPRMMQSCPEPTAATPGRGRLGVDYCPIRQLPILVDRPPSNGGVGLHRVGGCSGRSLSRHAGQIRNLLGDSRVGRGTVSQLAVGVSPQVHTVPPESRATACSERPRSP